MITQRKFELCSITSGDRIIEDINCNETVFVNILMNYRCYRKRIHKKMHSLLEDLNAQFPAHDDNVIQDFCRLMFGDVRAGSRSSLKNPSKGPNTIVELRADNLRALGSLDADAPRAEKSDLIGAFYPVNQYSTTPKNTTPHKVSAGGTTLEFTKKIGFSSGDKLSMLASIPEDEGSVKSSKAVGDKTQIVENNEAAVAAKEGDEPNVNVILGHMMHASMESVKNSVKMAQRRSSSYYGTSELDLLRRPG